MTRALIALLIMAPTVWASGPSMHPSFLLLDVDGGNVLHSGRPVSGMETCGQCHDTDFIAGHSFHADVGLGDLVPPGQAPSGRPWDTSPGPFGRWNPLEYRYLTPPGDDDLDLGTAAWIQVVGRRHVGGGPAWYGRNGEELAALSTGPAVDRDTHVRTAAGVEAWDWDASGGVEMNCFLCHTADADNEARVEALQSGAFRWASTATLARTGLVEKTERGWRWNADAFDASGRLRPDLLLIEEPTDRNCGFCHGLVHVDEGTPLVTRGCPADHRMTETTGQIVSPQRLADSGINLVGKSELSRAFDVHAERVVGCADCHYSINDPIYFQRDAGQPGHLMFDARRMSIGNYLRRPSHQLAKGLSALNQLAPEGDASMRRCESCHLAEVTHQWLPYWERHMDVIGCESCHIPRLYSGARRQFDWTLLTASGEPVTWCRGLDRPDPARPPLIQGYEPVLLPRDEGDGRQRLLPYNLISTWYWVSGNPPRPVRRSELERALLSNGTHHADVVAALDEDGDGRLAPEELRLDTPERVRVVQQRLAAAGAPAARIAAEIQPYGIHHNVTTGEWATRECQACHSRDSRMGRPFLLASYVPGGVIPEPVGGSNATLAGQMEHGQDGQLLYRPSSADAGLYVLGHDARPWSSWVGLISVLAVLMGVVVHTGLRWRSRSAAARDAAPPATERVYMHSAYERVWHWLQALAIIGLIWTGLEIHRPDTLGAIGFSAAVRTHNILATLVVINAVLSAFFHLTSGQIRHYLPEPRGFFSQAIQQARYYLGGFFRGEAHPFARDPARKLNPLQQVTYLAILNLLLPLQIITGAVMWGAQQWPGTAAALGGLTFLAPVHALLAWLFAAFLLMHIYLTTTGPTLLSSIRAMVGGWDEIERTHRSEKEQ